MKRKYGDCQRIDGNCTLCSLVSYGRDCRNRPISKLEWARMSVEISQKELSEKSGINVRYIQNVELGQVEAGNMTAKNIIALAHALDVPPENLI